MQSVCGAVFRADGDDEAGQPAGALSARGEWVAAEQHDLAAVGVAHAAGVVPGCRCTADFGADQQAGEIRRQGRRAKLVKQAQRAC